MPFPVKAVFAATSSVTGSGDDAQRRFASTTNTKVDPTTTRANFSKQMSEMYEKEVPQYTTLINLVSDVNRNSMLKTNLYESSQLARITRERHGAIRLGKPEELHTMGRLFAVMGMYPVAYYDLSQAGIPVHSTAFRPIDGDALECNPFRIFTSLLRIDLIKDQKIQAAARDILAKRDIFTPKVRELIDKFEKDGGLTEGESEEYVKNALESFRWHREATISHETYRKLKGAHPLVADVVAFKGPHINHLTPRTLDIDKVQELMPRHGMDAKKLVEGPPLRQCPILLRQTSFNALNESVLYYDNDDDVGNEKGGRKMSEGTHTARFGEIEQRGVALTPKGRVMYDTMLQEARTMSDSQNIPYESALETIFKEFPDDWELLRKQELAFFEYRVRDGVDKTTLKGKDIEDCIVDGSVYCTPITYEDFLPVSAAGIFTSNLGGAKGQDFQGDHQQEAFESILGRKVLCEMEIYKEMQDASLSFLK